MGLIGLRAQPALAIGFVIGVIPEPDHLAIALKGQDMAGDAVEETQRSWLMTMAEPAKSSRPLQRA